MEIGDRRSVFSKPEHPYTRKLLATVPIADPSRRPLGRTPMSDEIPSVVRSLDFIPTRLARRAISPTHFVRETSAA